MIKIKNYPTNSNYTALTFRQNQKNNAEKKNSNIKKILASSAAIAAGGALGGIAGDFYQRKRYPAMLLDAKDKVNAAYSDVKQFISTVGVTENETANAIGSNAYHTMDMFFRRMKDVKKNPRVENANCLMFISKDENKAKEAIDWFINASRQRYCRVNLYDEEFDFVKYLENLEKDYMKTKKWNLVHAENMEKLINPEVVQPPVIASMKAIMCSTAEDNHTTLLFHTKDPLKLDDAAIESNRITEFYNLDELKHFDKFKDVYGKYNKQLDLLSKLQNSKKAFATKNIALGAVLGAAVIGVIFAIKKMINKNNKETKN